MDSISPSKTGLSPSGSADPHDGAVAWCFLPVGHDQKRRCSRGFREFFEVDDEIGVNGSKQEPSLEDFFRQKQLPVEVLANDRPVSLDENRKIWNNGVCITSETIFDESGLPSGRMLIFEKQSGPKLPDQTVERLQKATRQLSILSPRESEILGLVYEGLTNKAIGIRSEISEKTVEKHRSNIMSKLGLQNSSQLIRTVSEARLGAELLEKTGNSAEQ